jgi:protein SCO1/2
MMRPLFLALVLSATNALAANGDLVGFSRSEESRLPDVLLLNEVGKQVHSHDDFAQPALLVFAYYRCPQFCGLLLSQLTDTLRRVQHSVGADFNVVVISIDPSDTSARALEQRQRHMQRYDRSGSQDGWRFRTADQPTIHTLTKAAGFDYVFDPIQHQFAHPVGIFVVHDQGVIAGRFDGDTFDPEAIEQALIAPPQTPHRSWTASFRAFCGAMNQAAGRYSSAVIAILQCFVLIILAALGCALGYLTRARLKAAAKS